MVISGEDANVVNYIREKAGCLIHNTAVVVSVVSVYRNKPR